MELDRPLRVITASVDGDVLAVLAGAHSWFTGRQVHQVAGRHSERGVRNALHRLCEQGIVIRERVGAADRYQLNRSHLAAPHIVALAHLRTEVFRQITALVEAWPIPARFVALFGSAAHREMVAGSDIDLLVVRPTTADNDDSAWAEQIGMLAEQVTRWTGNDTRILELSEAEVDIGLSAEQRVLIEIRDKGIALHGPPNYLHRPGVAQRRGAVHA